MYETGVPVSPTHKRLVKADGFHSTEETWKTSDVQTSATLSFSYPVPHPIGLSHHQPLRLGEEELFLLPDLHIQTISKGKHTHLTLLPFPTSLW